MLHVEFLYRSTHSHAPNHCTTLVPLLQVYSIEMVASIHASRGVALFQSRALNSSYPRSLYYYYLVYLFD